MSAGFVIKQFHNVGGVSSVITGIVESGEISEGAVGVTAKSKRFTVVKIEREGHPIRKAGKKDKVNLFVKYLSRSDIRMDEVLRF